MLIFRQDAFDLYHLHKPAAPHPSFPLAPALPALGHACAGAIGATVSNACTYPLSLLVMRLQIRRQLRRATSNSTVPDDHSLHGAARELYRAEGLAGLYAGLGADTAKTALDAFLFFLFYSALRRVRQRARTPTTTHLPALEELAVGYAAAALSRLFTTPAGVVVARLQTASLTPSPAPPPDAASPPDTTPAPRQPPPAAAIVSQILAERGLAGLWAGYAATLVLALNPALTFAVFEALKRALVPRARRAHPPPAATFALAAAGKAAASCATYPFALAKARAQCAATPVSEEDSAGEKPTEEEGHDTNGGATKKSVLATLRDIVREDGVAGLYEGLEAEVLKGTLSHGTTMLVKGAAHRAVVQTYFVLLRVPRRQPGPRELAIRVEEKAGNASKMVIEGARVASGKMAVAVAGAVPVAKEVAEGTVENAVEAVQDTVSGAQEATGSVLEDAGEIADLLADYVGREPEDRGLDFDPGSGGKGE